MGKANTSFSILRSPARTFGASTWKDPDIGAGNGNKHVILEHLFDIYSFNTWQHVTMTGVFFPEMILINNTLPDTYETVLTLRCDSRVNTETLLMLPNPSLRVLPVTFRQYLLPFCLISIALLTNVRFNLMARIPARFLIFSWVLFTGNHIFAFNLNIIWRCWRISLWFW